jgi:putative tryptophan/tyrosine transport system substrate-binding protein
VSRTVRTMLAVALGLGAFTASPAAPQTTPMQRIGVIVFGTPETDPNLRSFQAGLRDLGYVEGKNVVLEHRGARGKPERLPELARELVSTRPTLIFALGGDVAPFVRAATSTIPIIAAVSNDPVQAGLIASLARPGGNLTGVTFVSSDLAAKRVQLLNEMAPRIARVGVLWNPDHLDPEYRETQSAGRALGVQIHPLEVRRPGDFEGAFRAAAAASLEAIVVVSSRMMILNRQPISELATRHRMLLVTGFGGWPEVGALFSHGPDVDVLVRRAATYVDKCSRGHAQASFRSSSRRSSSSSSTSKRPRHTAWQSRPRCWSAPTRSSSKARELTYGRACFVRV